jgi:UDP-sulfoquinovose synthase
MKIIILGGDGFCGWPTSLHLSKRGHEILILDNLSRRKIDDELGTNSLTPIVSIQERIKVWNTLNPKPITFKKIDIAQDYQALEALIKNYKPDAIVHFAEQRSAPYSMKNTVTKTYTVNNNVQATHNLLVAITQSKLDIHLVHLGTMGVYGYGWTGANPIPEGYVNVELITRKGKLKKEILHPANPGSVYHLTKTLDQLMFGFYTKNDQLRITDLHQGIVWGTQTKETKLDKRLINRFDYDGDYGTVLNRFLMQAAIKHPLTIYGKGLQTRAFIHINNTVKCIEIAIQNPPKRGERTSIFNQVTETQRLIDLAKMIQKRTNAKIQYLENPRREDAQNDLVVDNTRFLELGLNPTTLNEGLMEEVSEIAFKYADRVQLDTIYPSSKWNN